MSKHTREPWSYCKRHNVIHGRGGCQGQTVVASPPTLTGKFHKSDLSLILVAPQLLMKLEEISCALLDSDEDIWASYAKEIDELVAIAKG